MILVDQVRFRPELFGDDKLEYTSVILNQQFDQMAPSWLWSNVQLTELQDETGYVQFGYDETTEFFTYSKNSP